MLISQSSTKRWLLGTVLFLMIPMAIVYATVSQPRTVYWIVVFNCLMYVAVIAFVALVGNFVRTHYARRATAVAILLLVFLAFAAPSYTGIVYIFPVAWLAALVVSLAHQYRHAS